MLRTRAVPPFVVVTWKWSGRAGDDTVVEDVAVFLQHQAIAAAAGRAW